MPMLPTYYNRYKCFFKPLDILPNRPTLILTKTYVNFSDQIYSKISSITSFCLCPESLLHVVSGCKSYLEEGRYTWRHNSALHFVASTLQSVRFSSLYADLPGFLSPCIITVDQLRPDMLLSIGKTTLYMIELTVGFETNLNSNCCD